MLVKYRLLALRIRPGEKSDSEKLDPASLVASNQDSDEANASPRRGWWQKRSG